MSKELYSNRPGRLPLTDADASVLRELLTEDERSVIEDTGLSRIALYRAGAGQSVTAGTRGVILAALTETGRRRRGPAFPVLARLARERLAKAGRGPVRGRPLIDSGGRPLPQTATDRGPFGVRRRVVGTVVGGVDRPGPAPAPVDRIDDAPDPLKRERQRLEPTTARDRQTLERAAAQTSERLRYRRVAGIADRSPTVPPAALYEAAQNLLPKRWGDEVHRWFFHLRERLGYEIEASRDPNDTRDLERFGGRVRWLREFDRQTIDALRNARNGSALVGKLALDEATKRLAAELGIDWVPRFGWDSPGGPVVERNALARDVRVLECIEKRPGLSAAEAAPRSANRPEGARPRSLGRLLEAGKIDRTPIY